MQNQSWLLITKYSLHPVKRKRAACLLQMMVIYGTCCLWLREKEDICLKHLSEQLVQVQLIPSWCTDTAGTAQRKESCAKKITCVCIKCFYSKVTPSILRSTGYRFGDVPPCYGQYKGPDTYTVCSSISIFKAHTGFACYMQKEVFEHFRETLKKNWVGFSMISWTLQQWFSFNFF